MKSNRIALLSTDNTPTTATAVEIASSLLHSFEQFGIERDAKFAERSAAIAFTNAIVIAMCYPDDAAVLAHALNLTPSYRESCRAVAQALVAEVREDDSWLANLRRCLISRWSQRPEAAEPDALSRQIIFAIAVGLDVGADQVELAEIIHKRALMLNEENRFLATRLMNWSNYGFRPSAEPFIEYVSAKYRETPLERRILCVEAGEIHICAKLLSDPWRLSFWVEQAWTRGRRFTEKHPDILRNLLSEFRQTNREYTLKLYQKHILQAAELTGRVDIERATLAYFAHYDGGRSAVDYCSAEQPRKLVRLAFDFAFWMGILSAIPLPNKVLSQE